MKTENNSTSRKIKRLIAILLAVILGYCALTAASIISFSEKDETRPADAAIVPGAAKGLSERLEGTSETDPKRSTVPRRPPISGGGGSARRAL